MKIFYKKDYLQAINSLEFIENSYDILSQDFAKVMKSNQEKIERIERKNKEFELLHRFTTLQTNAVKELEDKVKTLRGAKGGLTKQNNALVNTISKLKEENRDLKKQVTSLTKEIATLKTDRYKVKKIRAAQPKTSTLEMSMKRSVFKNEVKKILKEKSEIRGEN